MVVSGSLSSRANVFAAYTALCFVPIWEDLGGCTRRSSPSSASEGDRVGENHGCDFRRQFSVVGRCTCAGRDQATSNFWTRTLFRVVVLYCGLLSRSAFETRSTYVMPAIRRSSFVSNAVNPLKSSTLTIHVSQPCTAIEMMMEQNSLSFLLHGDSILLPYWHQSFEVGAAQSEAYFDVHWVIIVGRDLAPYVKMSTHYIFAPLSFIFGRDGLLNLDTRTNFVLSLLIFIPKVPVTTSRLSALVWSSATDPVSMSMSSAYASLSITIPPIIASLVASKCDIKQWRKSWNM